MSLPLSESCVHSLSDTQDENQSSFDRFGVGSNETFIAVVSRPTERILEVTDECMCELGMPDDLLEKYLQKRSQYRLNSAIDNPSDRAYTELELDRKYCEYVKNSFEAQSAISELVSRLDSGEYITIVCFEKSGKCHRHLLCDILESRVNNNFDLSGQLLSNS